MLINIYIYIYIYTVVASLLEDTKKSVAVVNIILDGLMILA